MRKRWRRGGKKKKKVRIELLATNAMVYEHHHELVMLQLRPDYERQNITMMVMGSMTGNKDYGVDDGWEVRFLARGYRN